MIIRKIILLLFAAAIYSPEVFSQADPLSRIDIPDLKKHLSFIASDSLQGRSFGTEINGLEITANYLAAHAKKTGLIPAAKNYFQEISIVKSSIAKNNGIRIFDSNSRTRYESQKLVCVVRGSDVTDLERKEMVLAGFGEKNTETGYNDLAKTDIKGKIVIVAMGSVETFKIGNFFRWNSGMEREKIDRIAKEDPAAIIIVTNPQDKKNNTYQEIAHLINRSRFYLDKKHETRDEVSVFVVPPEFADNLLGRKGRYRKYLERISWKGSSNTYLVTKRSLSLKSAVNREKYETKNVVGYIEGSDPELKDEYIIYVAHYDHMGVSNNGDVYNGADDNGSGTVTLMEVAEAFMSLEKKPKRSIVFLWVTAEERGLLGSEHYTEHPIFPLAKTVACVNIDMAGRVYEPRDSVKKSSPKVVKDFDGLYTVTNDIWPELTDITNAACQELGLVPDHSLPEKFLRSSDHYHFHRMGVPILNLATGYHADYHKPGDEVERINFEKIKRVADLCFLLGMKIANTENIDIVRAEQ